GQQLIVVEAPVAGVPAYPLRGKGEAAQMLFQVDLVGGIRVNRIPQHILVLGTHLQVIAGRQKLIERRLVFHPHEGGIRVGPRITITLAHGPQLGFVFLYFINLGLGNPPQAGASHLQVFLGGLGLRGLTAGIRGGIGLAAGDLLFAASYRLVGLLGRFGYLLGGPGWLAGLFGRGPVGPLSFLQVSQGLDLVKIIFDALDRRLLVAGAVFPPHRAVTAGVGLQVGPVYG